MTRSDAIWGTGRDPDDGEDWLYAHRAPWPGQNILGWAWMAARAVLRAEHACPRGT